MQKLSRHASKYFCFVHTSLLRVLSLKTFEFLKTLPNLKFFAVVHLGVYVVKAHIVAVTENLENQQKNL